MAAAGFLLHNAATRRAAATRTHKGVLLTDLQAPPQGGEGGAARSEEVYGKKASNAGKLGPE